MLLCFLHQLALLGVWFVIMIMIMMIMMMVIIIIIIIIMDDVKMVVYNDFGNDDHIAINQGMMTPN